MTTNELQLPSPYQGVVSLTDLARQRYLDAGGHPDRAANCNEWLTEAEQAEFINLLRQIATGH
jgi:hypothetical protein